MVSRVPRWWTRPVYSPAARLLTNSKDAAARRHFFKLVKDIPAEGDVSNTIESDGKDKGDKPTREDQTEGQHRINEPELFMRKETEAEKENSIRFSVTVAARINHVIT